MTEAEWNRCTDSFSMLHFLTGKGKASDRKLRLFACACARRAWEFLPPGPWREAIEVAERSGLPFTSIRSAADRLVEAGLLAPVSPGS